LIEPDAAWRLADGIGCDVLTIRAMTAEQLLGCEDLLAGCDYGDNDSLDRWVVGKRQWCRHELADALAGHVAVLERDKRVVEALQLNQRVLAWVPLQEHAWRRQMRLHYLRGDNTAAIEAFKRFEAILFEDSAGRPHPETLELLDTIEGAKAALPVKRAVAPAALQRPPRLVGRQPPLREMAEAWESRTASILWAEAGMGKTRLLEEFLHGRAGIAIVACRPGDSRTPYAVLRRMLQSVLARHTLALDEFDRREIARLVPEIGAASIVPGQQDALWLSVERLLASAVADGLSALVVDDLHDADLATVEALRWLCASESLDSLRFGFAARPLTTDDIATVLRGWAHDPHRLQIIELDPLSFEEVAELLESIGLPELAPVSLAPQLFRHAGGHPMFLLETLRHRLQVDPNGPLPMPRSAMAAIDERLRGLSPLATNLLRVAAVCDAALTAERAAQLLGRSVLDLAEPWAQLESSQIMRGSRFVHELMREAALRLTPGPVREAMHRDVAGLLARDASVPPSTLAAHWQAAKCWLEAARCWHVAGRAARHAGRLVEQSALLAQAADCYRQCADTAGEFEARHDGLDSLLVRAGGAAVLVELPRLEALAESLEHRLKLLFMRTEALLDLTRSDEAVLATTEAVRAARQRRELLADALCLHGMALAQTGQLTQALAAGREAADLAITAGSKVQALRATRSLAYVLFHANEIRSATRMQRQAVQLAGELGDGAELALGEGNLATFLTLVGDPGRAYLHAQRARDGHRRMGSSVNGTQGGLNLANLGTAAAYLGRYDEALQALTDSERVLDENSSPAAAALARIALAGIWLTLGCADAARACLARMPAATPSIMQAQWHMALARADGLEGRSAEAHLQRVRTLLIAQPGLERTPALWYHWSRYCARDALPAKLRPVRIECERQGQHGAAAALAVREHARWLEAPPGAANADLLPAGALVQRVARGLHASTYPPEAWWILARVLERNGDPAAGTACRSSALNWIRAQALPHVPEAYRKRFLECNPVNRTLLGDVPAGEGLCR